MAGSQRSREGSSGPPVGKIQRLFHERAALELLGRDGIAVIWRLHLDAAERTATAINAARYTIATTDRIAPPCR